MSFDAVRTVGLRKSFQTALNEDLLVLSGLTFSVKEGEFCAIIGPNGCGKTTLLREGPLVRSGVADSEPAMGCWP